MRSRTIAFAAALVVASAASASAQATLPAPTGLAQSAAAIDGKPYGSIDFGARVSDINGDAARYQRYRDLRDGAFLENAFLTRRGQDWTLEVKANKIGYRDQGFAAEYRMPGRLKATVLWDQVPMFISQDTRTLYSQPSAGVFRLDDTLQANNQAGVTTIRNYLDQATGFDTRTRRDVGSFDLVYNATRDLDLKLTVTTTPRTGSIPYGAPFGFSNLIELPAPIDQRTNDAKAQVEWANRKGFLRVGWDGSWFNNNVETLVWDNPLRIDDRESYSGAYSDGRSSSQGRMALWPDSMQQYIHGTGSVATPGRGRLTAYLAIGESRQDQPLLPHTINSLIPSPLLERGTADASIRNTMFNLQYTARPVRQFGVVARYRYADVDNRTPHFETFGRVRFDGVLDDAAASPEPEPYSVKRQNFDVDGTWSALSYTAIKVGYGNAIVDRTFRHWEETKEDVFRVSVDSVGNRYVTVRALFENSAREGRGLDLHVLEAVSEQPGMRQFDIADRDRRRYTLIATVMPHDIVGLTASAGIGREKYPASELGLQDFDTDQYSVGIDLFPNDRIGFNVTYAWEDYGSRTTSRQINASPGGAGSGIPYEQWASEPRNNWSMDYIGRVRNLDAMFDVRELVRKTDLRLGVNWSDVTDTYTYGVRPDNYLGSTPPLSVFQPRQLAPVLNELFRGTVDLTYQISRHWRAGASYWYEEYKTDDFALGPVTLGDLALPLVQPGATPTAATTLILGYMYKPYVANTGFLRLTYLW